MRKIIFFVTFAFIFVPLYSQNIRLDSEYSKNWIKFINKKTIDMRGALYEAFGNGNMVLMSGQSPLMLVKTYTFLGAMSDNHAYYSHQITISILYDNAPNMGLRIIEGYSVTGYTLNRYAKYQEPYNKKVDEWNNKNAVYKNGRWVANNDADWKTYPIPQAEDVNWDDGAYAGELY